MVIAIVGRASDNFRNKDIKRGKELIPNRMQRGSRVITFQGAIEKSPIFLSKNWKNESLDGTITISYLMVAKYFRRL